MCFNTLRVYNVQLTQFRLTKIKKHPDVNKQQNLKIHLLFLCNYFI